MNARYKPFQALFHAIFYHQQRRSSQEEQLRVEPGDIEGTASDQRSNKGRSALPKEPNANRCKCDKKAKNPEGKRWMG